MSLSSNQLDAFSAVARHGSFSVAAQKLNITQSALSQRVLNLEKDLGATLFVREPSGVRLTDLGHRLLRYTQTKDSLESEFLHNIHQTNSKSLTGLVRIAGFSTFNRSVLLPVLSGFVQTHPDVRLELRHQELRELIPLLTSGATDYVFTSHPPEKQGLESHRLGFEENVLVQASSKRDIPDVYLDHDPEDGTTLEFFRVQGRKTPSYHRSYLGEIYTILEGVRSGLGRAVAPLHLVKAQKGLEVVKGFKSLKTPIYLCHYTQAYYTDLHKQLMACMLREIPLRIGRY